MNSKIKKWHILCEKDVGLFSLIQQVISHIPLALSEGRIPVALYGSKCCYWTHDGYMETRNVWEYYFEPIIDGHPSPELSEKVLSHIKSNHPHFEYPGYHIDENVFVSSHFGDHKAFKGKTLKIPHRWKDPDLDLRKKASEIIEEYVRPRSYIKGKVDEFFKENMEGVQVIGVHMRATDVTDPEEHNIHRRGSYKFESYVQQIARSLEAYPLAKIFVATDSQKALEGLKEVFPESIIHSSTIFHSSEKTTGAGPSGWVIPGYLAEDPRKAAQNGEEAIIDYLLLSRCQYLIHNGSGLARTALLKNPELPHINIHTKQTYLKSLFSLGGQELFQYLKFSYRHGLHKVKKPIKRLLNWEET